MRDGHLRRARSRCRAEKSTELRVRTCAVAASLKGRRDLSRRPVVATSALEGAGWLKLSGAVRAPLARVRWW